MYLIYSKCIGARVGHPDEKLLHKINKLCAVVSLKQAKAKSHPNALYITPTNRKVKAYNDAALEDLIQQGATTYRSVAIHTAATDNCICIDDTILPLLFKHTAKSSKKDQIPEADITFAIGQRVRVTVNAGTQVGIYNGSQGTVHSFGFINTSSIQLHPDSLPHKVAQVQSEKPIIFVQMDKMSIDPKTQCEFSCSTEVPRLVPFFPIQSESAIRCQGNKYYRHQYALLPAHALSTHKSQGLTARNGTVLDIGPKDFHVPGMAYVGMSRNTCTETMVSMNTFHLRQFHLNPTYKAAIEAEYSRLAALML